MVVMDFVRKARKGLLFSFWKRNHGKSAVVPLPDANNLRGDTRLG
jgi:hypothetical protein